MRDFNKPTFEISMPKGCSYYEVKETRLRAISFDKYGVMTYKREQKVFIAHSYSDAKIIIELREKGVEFVLD